jgi:hypothetical protein
MELDPVILRGVAGNDRFGIITRPKIDNDEFKVAKGLPENAFNRLGKKAIDIAGNHRN